MTLTESFTLVFDPAWPWSNAAAGLPALAVVALIIIAVTIFTYRGVQGATSRRMWTLIGLRLAALLVACLVVLRPSVSSHEELRAPAVLVIAADNSESMT